MKGQTVPLNLRKIVQDFYNAYDKFSSILISKNNKKETVVGIQIGNTLDNIYEMVIHINVTTEKINGYVLKGANIPEDMIACSKDFAESLLKNLTLTEIFKGI